MMLGKQYVVRQGDTLWNLSNQFLGDPLKWPEIYEHNNQSHVASNTGTRISDPDLIFIGQRIYIPVNKPASHSIPKRSIQTKPGTPKKPARRMVYSIPFKYELDGLPAQTVASPAYIATISLKGSITVQPDKAITFVAMTWGGFELTAKQEADEILGNLISEVKLDFNPAKNEIKFECGFTTHSKHPYAPSAKLAVGTSSKSGLPVFKSSIVAPDIKGKINDYVYMTSGLEIEIEITPNKSTKEVARALPKNAPSPASQTAPENDFWDQLLGGALIVGAGAIIVATIVEDIITAGGGMVDDPASFAAASVVFFRGLALMKKVRTGVAIRIEPAVVFAH